MSWKYYLAALTCAGAVLLAGCRSGGPLGKRAAETPAEPPPTLSGAQVADVQAAMARTLDMRGESEQAMQYYQEAVRKDPSKGEWWGRIAVLADKQGLFVESEEAHRRAIALEPTNADFHCNSGYSLQIQQRWDESAAALRRALELKPDHKRASNNLGLTLARSGSGPEALEKFQRAGCSKADACANLAYALTLNGDLDNARRQYEVALRHEPSSDAARKGLENLTALTARLAATAKDAGENQPKGKPSQSTAPAPTVVAVAYTPNPTLPVAGVRMAGTPRAVPDSVPMTLPIRPLLPARLR